MVKKGGGGGGGLIFDLRYINKHLSEQSGSFEDWKEFQNYVSVDLFLYKFDMQKAIITLILFGASDFSRIFLVL